MKITRSLRKNIFLLIIVLVLIIPQTRQPIQILLHKGLALFSPSVVDKEDRIVLTNYDWKLIDEKGRPFNFIDAKDKVVVINFWATWCPPCIAEMPSLEKLYKHYKNDVVFLFVSNENIDVITKFKIKHDYDFLVYASVTDYPLIFDVNSIPRTFIIDKKGTIIVDKTGAANWNSDSVKQMLDGALKSE